MNMGEPLGEPSRPPKPSPTTAPWHGIFSQKELEACMAMARLHNTLPALLLVLLGAWVGAGRELATLVNPAVWLMGAISAGVSAASMVINDFFDHRSGTDAVNAPHKPLPSGQVQPDTAALMAGSIYIAVLVAACAMESPAVRGIVAFSAVATLLYTPVFKRVTMVKNALVACIIALAPLSGALAAGASLGMLWRLAVPCAFTFAAIMFREVLMDCSDEPGDRAANVRTLPVLLGPGPALLLASTLLLAGAAGGLALLLTTAASGGAPAATLTLFGVTGLPDWPALGCAAVVTLSILKLVSKVARVFAAGFTSESLDSAVEGSVPLLGLSIIMLAAMA